MSSPFQIFLAYFGVFLSKSGHFLTKIRKNERSLSTFFIPPMQIARSRQIKFRSPDSADCANSGWCIVNSVELSKEEIEVRKQVSEYWFVVLS